MEEVEQALPQYTVLKVLGKGGYGCVYEAQHKENNVHFAIKRVSLYYPEDDTELSNGISVDVLRESSALKVLSHPGIIGLVDIITQPKHLMYVLELCDGGDLSTRIADLREQMSTMPWDMLRSFTRQIIEATAYMHSCRIAHRDIKTLNIVIQGQHTLKICDFGMSRQVKTGIIPNDATIHDNPRNAYTTGCTTLWYRPPELLMNAKHYNPFSLDLWSIGCVIAEMIRLEPLIMKGTEKESIKYVFRMFGTPTETTWPGVTKLLRTQHSIIPQRNAEELFVNFKDVVPPDVMVVMNGMLSVNPYKRMSASEALRHMKETEEAEWKKAKSIHDRKENGDRKRRRIEFIESQ